MGVNEDYWSQLETGAVFLNDRFGYGSRDFWTAWVWYLCGVNDSYMFLGLLHKVNRGMEVWMR